MSDETPALGARYVKRAEPDKGRIVTVNRVWEADDGHTAVAYEWHDPRASYAGSACPLDVFHRTYRAEAGDLFEELWSMEYRITGDKPKAQAFARAFLDRHAHELAEKIRSASAQLAVFRSEDMQARADHGRRMADLIDPEVPDGG